MTRWQHILASYSLGLRIGNKTIFRLLCKTVKFEKENLFLLFSDSFLKLRESLEVEMSCKKKAMSAKKKAKNKKKPRKSFKCDQCDKVTVKKGPSFLLL